MNHSYPTETRNVMSAFSQKEIAALLKPAQPTDLKINALKQFIARIVPEQAQWDQMYIMAWRALSSMRGLCERNTTDKVFWYWGVPYTPRNYTSKAGQNVQVRCMLSSEYDDTLLAGIWKHEHSRLLTLYTELAKPEARPVWEEFMLGEILFESIDIQSDYKLLTWVAKDESLPIVADNGIFVRMATPGASVDKPECGSIFTPPKPAPAKVSGTFSDVARMRVDVSRNPKRTDTTAYSRGNAFGIQPTDESPYDSRKGANAKLHDRRNKAKSKQRSKWDD